MKYTPPLGEAENASYTDGNPEHGILGSVVPAKAVESPQREVVKVIQEAGLTPSDNDLTQLLQAIIKIIGVKVPLAKVGTPGIMSPDDKTCTVDAKGVLSVLLATAARAGIMQPDGTTCAVDPNGVLSVIKKADAAVERLEVLRKLTIGAPKFHRSTVLPDDHAWPDGSFIEFDDWPEFGEVYEQGGFTGLVMPWDADTEEQAANLGKYRPNSANPTGLYLPLHGGQFFRNWTLGTGREAGSWGRDEVRNIRGAIPPYDPGRLPAGIERGAFCQVEGGGNVPIGASGQRFYHVLDISCVVPTGPQNVPQHVWQPIILYLGRPK
ncbi:hypothetical protein CE91St39_21960 [Desulfovibrionaceae bacterium]|nr:hypothetical protein CE91St39_21960 [Desulfovibrionaceae bacterium]